MPLENMTQTKALLSRNLVQTMMQRVSVVLPLSVVRFHTRTVRVAERLVGCFGTFKRRGALKQQRTSATKLADQSTYDLRVLISPAAVAPY